MIIAQLKISFPRGRVSNLPQDLGLSSTPVILSGESLGEDSEGEDSTGESLGEDLLCGLGTHFPSKEAKDEAARRTAKEQAIRNTFRRTFVAASLDGCFILSRNGEGRELLDTLEVLPGMDCRVIEFDASPTEALPQAELADWADKIKEQFTNARLGRGRGNDWAETDKGKEGISVLARLASCPVLTQETRDNLAGLIDEARLMKVDRLNFKRRLTDMNFQVTAEPVAPRRAPIIEIETTTDEGTPGGGEVVPFRRFAL